MKAVGTSEQSRQTPRPSCEIEVCVEKNNRRDQDEPSIRKSEDSKHRYSTSQAHNKYR